MTIANTRFNLGENETAVSLEADTPIPAEEEMGTPLGWCLLVKPVEPATKIGSIMLTTSAIDRQSLLGNVGRVVSVGSLAYKTGDLAKIENPPKRGDYIMYRQHSGERFKYKGEEYVMVTDNTVTWTGFDPAKIQLFSV